MVDGGDDDDDYDEEECNDEGDDGGACDGMWLGVVVVCDIYYISFMNCKSVEILFFWNALKK